MNKSELGDLKLADLILMVELAETHSLREVARRHSMNPSQLSKMIKRIEEKSGRSLINRTSQRMTFTLEGMQFLKAAKEIIKLTPNLSSGKLENPPRTYVIASTSYINQYMLSSCVGNITSDDNKNRFRLIDMGNKDQIIGGLKGVFEISLHVDNLNWPKTWVSKRVGFTKAALYGRKGHPLGTKTTSAEVLKYPFVVPIRATKNGIQNGEDNCPIPIQDRIHGHGSMTGATALGFIKSTNQVSYLPEIVARESLANGEIIEIHVTDWKIGRYPLYLSARADLVPQKLYNQLIKEISSQL